MAGANKAKNENCCFVKSFLTVEGLEKSVNSGSLSGISYIYNVTEH